MINKKDKRDRKMTEEQLQALLHMRKRGYVQKNGKAYNRKTKHKGKDDNQWKLNEYLLILLKKWQKLEMSNICLATIG